ncbi:hypothetical protein ACSLBF_07335 [Pseudoalteromonas sp. T1lg65]|uniref:hypothetical protein n=1 Tax=Pseudoalteromonas sp. T1lg65 TaxID=2077101 RepID=UPI003F7ACB93
MSSAIQNYIDTLYAGIDIDPVHKQACLKHCLDSRDIYAWVYTSELNNNDLFLRRLIGIKKPRELQIPMHQPDNKEKSNSVKLFIPEVLSSEATERVCNQQDVDAKKAQHDKLIALKLSELTHYKASKIINFSKHAGSSPVWVNDNPISYIEEFHQEVKEHLNLTKKSAKGHQSTQSDNAHTLKVSNDLINALHQRGDNDAPKCGELLMKLNKPEAFFPHQHFEGEQLYASLFITDISIHCFATGVKMLCMSVSYQNLVIKQGEKLTRAALKLEDIATLNEVLSNTYLNKNQAQVLYAEPQQGQGVFWLQLLTALLGLDESAEQPIDCESIRRHWDIPRPFTYTIVHIGKEQRKTVNRLHDELKLDYLHSLQSKLAFQEDLNYFRRDKSQLVTLGDSDIRHQFSRQGGCTLLNPNRLLEHKELFFQNYIANNGNRYTAIALLAYAEYYFLITMQNRLAMPATESPCAEVLDRLTQQYKLLTSHRINYRFAEVSRIDTHNRAYECWDKVLTISRLHKYLGEDIQDYRNVIELYHRQQTAEHEQQMQEIARQRAEQEKRHDKKIKRIATMGTALIFLAGVFGTNFYEMTSMHNGGPVVFFSSDWHAVLIGLVILATTWFVTLNSHKRRAATQSFKQLLDNYPNATKYAAIGLGLICIFGWGYQFCLHLFGFILSKIS